MKWKLIEIKPGDLYPKYGYLEEWSYRKDLERWMRENCQASEGHYFENPGQWKEERLLEAAGQVCFTHYGCVVLELEPETNEFGEVSP